MASVSLPDFHPDLKLGLLLVAAAMLLHVGSSGAFEALLVPHDRLDISLLRYRLIIAALALGSLFVIGTGFWVDRRPPHGLMATGALLLSLGLVVANFSRSFGVALAGMFLSGAGGAFAGSLVFYAVAVKASGRFRGALLGALGLVFNVKWEAWTSDVGWSGWTVTGDATGMSIEATGLSIWWVAVCLVLASGALLFLLLPRCFSANYEPGPTLSETAAVPGAKSQIAWVAAVYLVGAMIITAETTHLQWVTLTILSDGIDTDFAYRSLALAGGLGALAWGVAADFFPVRRLLIILALLFLPAAGWGWVLDDLEGGVFLLSLVGGGLITLTWVLMAEVLPKHHFAKLALGVTLAGSLGRMLGPLYWGSALAVWGVESFFWIVLVEAGLLAAVVACRPRLPETAGNQPIQQP